MLHTLKLSRWSRLLVLLVVLPLSSCCEDTVYTYEDALQRLDQDRMLLRRVTVQRAVVEKLLVLARRTASRTPNPPEYLRQAQLKHDEQAKELDQQIVQERERLRADEALIAGMRSGG